MSGKKKSDLSIRIDVQYNRINIHHSALREIGDPEYISIGVHPLKRHLAVLGTSAKARGAIRVRYSDKGPYMIRSKALIDSIRRGCNCMNNPGSYLLKGKLDKTVPAIYYSLDEARMLIDDEDKCNHEDQAEHGSGI